MSRPINKEWMKEKNRVGPVYTKGVEDFIEFANKNNDRLLTTLSCPCVKCRNGTRRKPLDVRNHLVRHGIDRSYTLWALHGEKPSMNSKDHLPVEDVHEENIKEEDIEDEVKAAGNRRKCKSLNREGGSETCEDLDNDELAEVFGKKRKGGVRAVGSHISKKQLIHIGMAKSKIEEKNKVYEEAASLKDDIISLFDSRVDKIEGMMLSILSKLSNVSTPPLATTSSSEIESNSVNRPTYLSQNLDNVSGTMGISHSPHSRPTPTDNSPVILLDKFGKELAKGYVVTDATAKVCHFKHVGIGEKKVYIEEVIDPDARLYDPPQGGHNILADFVQGGFVIWLECWLRYV